MKWVATNWFWGWLKFRWGYCELRRPHFYSVKSFHIFSKQAFGNKKSLMCMHTTQLHFHITYTLHKYVCRYLHTVVNVRTWWEYILRQSAFRRTVNFVYILPLFVHLTHSLTLVGIPLYSSSSVGLHLIKGCTHSVYTSYVIWKNCRKTFL